MEQIKWRQLLNFDLSYWYILGLHVLYAAVFFPFRTTYAIEYFQHAKGLTLQQAGVANSWVFFAAIFATPFFGLLADRLGHRALMLSFGTLLLPLTFVVLGLTNLNLWVSTVMMGISFVVGARGDLAGHDPDCRAAPFGHRVGTDHAYSGARHGGLEPCRGPTCRHRRRGRAESRRLRSHAVVFFLLSLTALLSAVLLWRREAGPHGHNLESARAGA